MVQEADGTTLFSGTLEDQAALYGILTQMRGLSLTRLFLSIREGEPSDEPGK